jgi:tripartite-type tricarboxylate transporter receptor subunit TctC
MMRIPSSILQGVLLVGAAFLLPANAQAQPFPAKPIEIVVHVNPGGGADVFARYVTDIVNREKLLPQPMAVVNKAGGAHAVAANYTAAKRGDPYTVLTIAHSSFLVVPAVSGLDLGLDKFVPLALFGMDSHTLTVRADSAHKTLKDITEAARRSPKSVIAGVGTIGGTAHMVGYLLEKQTGGKFNFIGLKGGGEAVLGVLGGHYQVCFENLSEVIEHVQAKKMRILGIPTEKRLPYLPDVPTMKEQGYPMVVGVGRGFLAPAGIPNDARATLEAAFEKAYRTSAWKEFAARNMFDDVFLKGPQFEQWLKNEQPLLTQFVRDVGLAKQK